MLWNVVIIDVALTWNINIFDVHKPNLYIHCIHIITQNDSSMSSLPHKMGEADSITNIGNPVLSIFWSYHKNILEPFLE